MKKILLLTVLLAFLLQGCQSWTFLDMKLGNEKTVHKINPMKVITNGTTLNDIGKSYFFLHEMKYNVCQLTPEDTLRLDKENIGTVSYRLLKDKNRRNPLLFLLFMPIDLATLCLPAVVGIPVGHRVGVVKLAVDVKDASGNIIKTYIAKGKNTTMLAGWWGYKREDAEDRSRDKAFYKALLNIKQQMDDDATFLNSRLPNATLTPDEIQANKYIAEGNKAFEAKNYPDAIASYTKALPLLKNTKPSHALMYYRLGYSYSDQDSEADNAIKYLKKALEINPTIDYMAPVSMYIAYKNKNDFRNAIVWLDYTIDQFGLNEKQKNLLREWKKECERAIPQIEAGAKLKEQPVNVIVRNMGNVINGVSGDYFPSITADESMLLFTSRRAGSTGGLKDGKYDEDLWYSTKDSTGKWLSPKNFGTPVNTPQNNGIASFTGDGQFVVCGRCNEVDGFGGCDIYGATLVGNTWKTPVNMGKVVNSKEWDAQVSISADGKTLVFCSTRAGGYGEEDIWMTKKNNNGQWSEPRNLGNMVNTTGSEFSPYLHPDGKTLYFASNNRSPRIGGTDIYKTTMNDDGSFTMPENLGYPINTEFNDNYFVLSPSGLKGYFASNRPGGFGADDVYEITFPEEKKTKLTTFVGYVLDDETKQPLEAGITIDDLDSAKVVGTYVSNSASGKFVVILTPGHNYALTVSKGGYLFYSENFNIDTNHAFQEVNKEVLLQRLKEGKKIVLNNIFFETGKATLTDASTVEIQKLYELLQQNPLIRVEISGHTDNVGNDDANLKLSQDRANVVVQVLISKGIPSARLIAKGYGETQPYGPNDTDEQRALNRRTEFKIISAQ